MLLSNIEVLPGKRVTKHLGLVQSMQGKTSWLGLKIFLVES